MPKRKAKHNKHRVPSSRRSRVCTRSSTVRKVQKSKKSRTNKTLWTLWIRTQRTKTLKTKTQKNKAKWNLWNVYHKFDWEFGKSTFWAINPKQLDSEILSFLRMKKERLLLNVRLAHSRLRLSTKQQNRRKANAFGDSKKWENPTIQLILHELFLYVVQ